MPIRAPDRIERAFLSEGKSRAPVGVECRSRIETDRAAPRASHREKHAILETRLVSIWFPWGIGQAFSPSKFVRSPTKTSENRR